FVKRATAGDLRSLELVVSGAEKMPVDLHHDFRDRFNLGVTQGYGMTEAAPVTNFNQPDPLVGIAAEEDQTGHRLGSVGRLLPGMSARILDPDTRKELPVTATGLIAVRGPNIFAGYLDYPEANARVLRDGWYNTGDLGRSDEEGFLFVEGRL